ncbi:c-type cytochrome [Brevundimonas sp. GN22]
MSAKLKPAPMIATLSSVIACALALSACGSEPAAGPAPKSGQPAPTHAEKALLLASLPAPYNAGDLENGRRVFARCRSCHTITDGGPNMTGPNLYGVFGSEVGTHEKFRYSEALKSADFVWDADKLNQWLERPGDFLPGNKMSFVGIAAEQDRRDVIAFLKVETGYAPAK